MYPQRRICVKRLKVFEDNVFIENSVLEVAQNAGRNLRADVVLRRSRGSPGQWFPKMSISFCDSKQSVSPRLEKVSESKYIEEMNVCEAHPFFFFFFFFFLPFKSVGE